MAEEKISFKELTEKDKMKKSFLNNYLEDLEHLASQGLYSLNYSTNGTPEFKNKKEFVKYIFDLKKCIDREKANGK